MDQKAVNKATDALIAATRKEAVASGVNVEARAAQRAPGLAIGSNIPGGYNYQRNVAPIIEPLTRSLVVSAKQELLKSLLKETMGEAQNNYATAKIKHDRRYREFQKQQAERQRERQKKYDAQQASAMAAQIQSLKNANAGKLANKTPAGKVISKAVPKLKTTNSNASSQPLKVTPIPQQKLNWAY